MQIFRLTNIYKGIEYKSNWGWVLKNGLKEK